MRLYADLKRLGLVCVSAAFGGLCACAPERPAVTDAATAPARAEAPSSVPAPSPSPTPAAAPVLAVDGEGLRLVNPGNGSTRPLAFGAPQAQVLTALERFRGPAGQGDNSECRLQYANWADGLSLTFRNGQFLGWSLDRRAAGALTTMSGIGPGSTRRELLDAYSAEISQTSLGLEFTAGDMAGLLDGASQDARITDLWAGETCIAR